MMLKEWERERVKKISEKYMYKVERFSDINDNDRNTINKEFDWEKVWEMKA